MIHKIDETVEYIRTCLGSREVPQVAIILGSGLGLMADHIADPLVIPYAGIPNFVRSTAIGHKGNLIIGTLGGKHVMAMQGRFHYYEGYTMQEVTFPVRVMARLGVKVLFVSNAAGAVNPTYRVGDMMIITDHINLLPNPLIGPNMDEFGPRFPDMTTVYSTRIRQLAIQEAAQMGETLQQGVYVAGTGPTYETRAEYRFYGAIGGDAAGMSTIPEVIVARHSGLEIFGMSIITNQSNDLSDNCLNDGDDVVKQANLAAEKMTALFERVIAKLDVQG
ncbi:MAG: purine nucleoside phosphorylase I, inosine and guanosine-specific [Bacteroidales bacterium]|nr:purine nucleoside phosphorylase I, inosine and guanosine-specific [Bacteroidales bacterium]